MPSLTHWLQALHRYCKFLHLANVRKDLMVVPMYDIDLLWHTHLSMNPSAYPEQCRSAIGWVSPASVLRVSLRLRHIMCKTYLQREHGFVQPWHAQ
jgi:hypothetical protein